MPAPRPAEGQTGKTAWLVAGQAGLALVLGFLGALFLANVGNTLYENGQWTSEKVRLRRGAVGAVATMVTRPPLHRNQLDLGSYLGFQYMVHRLESPLTRATLQTWMGGGSSLDLLFGMPGQAGLSRGLRLSCSPDFKSKTFKVNDKGEFLEDRPIALNIPCDNSDFLRVELELVGDTLACRIDGQAPVTIEGWAGPFRSFGVRSSMAGATVDDIDLDTAAGKQFHEDFANWRGLLRALPFTTLAALFFAFMLYRCLGRLSRLDRMTRHKVCFSMLLPLSLIGALLVAFDFYYLATRYPIDVEKVDFKGYVSRIESWDAALKRLAIEQGNLSDQAPRIMLVGSSQTWGAGALAHEDVIDRVLERLLPKATGQQYKVINTGIPGGGVVPLFAMYKAHWIQAQPELTVINLGHNDNTHPLLAKYMNQFVSLNRRAGIKTVFVLEPNAMNDPQNRHRGRAVIRQVANKRRVPLVDMHSLIRVDRERGFLWWDDVHLTSFGQELFARKLVSELLRLGLFPGTTQGAGLAQPGSHGTRFPEWAQKC